MERSFEYLREQEPIGSAATSCTCPTYYVGTSSSMTGGLNFPSFQVPAMQHKLAAKQLGLSAGLFGDLEDVG